MTLLLKKRFTMVPGIIKLCLLNNMKDIIFFSSLKGVFAKNESGYRLTSKHYRWGLLLILLLRLIPKNVASIQIQKVEYSTRFVKKSIYFLTNHSDITTIYHLFFFDAFLHSSFFIILFPCFIYNILQITIIWPLGVSVLDAFGVPSPF